MPGGRGGRRRGTPGEAYSNRTDLATNYAPSTPQATPASGAAPTPAPQPGVYPEDIPKLDDPSAYPDRPITDGLPNSPGVGPEAMPQAPADTSMNEIRAAYMANPTPQLEQVMRMMSVRSGPL